LRDAVISKVIAFTHSTEITPFVELMLASPFDNIPALADLQAFRSAVEEKEEDPVAIHSRQKSIAIYTNAGISHPEAKYQEALTTYLQINPEAAEAIQKLVKWEMRRSTCCPHCRTEIANHSQKFCYVCGTELEWSKEKASETDA
jgi:hypothetical protein